MRRPASPCANVGCRSCCRLGLAVWASAGRLRSAAAATASATTHYRPTIHPEEVHPVANREFTVAGAYRYNQRGPVRWIASHILRYKGVLAVFVCGTVLGEVLLAVVPSLIGVAFNIVARGGPSAPDALLHIAL